MALRGRFWQAVWGAGVLAPVVVITWLLTHPALNTEIEVPVEHFIVVITVSVIALVVAVILALSAVQIANYRILLLALGFVTLAGIFAVHGATTPGIIVEGGEYASSAAGVSAFLSLVLPSVFFAAAYTPIVDGLDRNLPFSAARALLFAVLAAIAVYALVALGLSQQVAGFLFAQPPLAYVSSAISLSLLGFAAWQQSKTYRITRLPLQLALLGGFALLGESQLDMTLSDTWTFSWWAYHFLMLAAVSSSLVVMLKELAQGRRLRTTLEAALDTQIKVDQELTSREAITALAAAVEARDENTEGHNIRVADWALRIGREMRLSNQDLRVLARAGLLHDVGKIGIPDAILAKPGPLNEEEWAVIRRHPEMGVDILSRIGSLRREAEVVAAHHERMDGSGYPRSLSGEDIPLLARIIAVADTYDVLVSDRPYRRAHSPERAVQILQEERGIRLYPQAVDALLSLLRRKEDLDDGLAA